MIVRVKIASDNGRIIRNWAQYRAKWIHHTDCIKTTCMMEAATTNLQQAQASARVLECVFEFYSLKDEMILHILEIYIKHTIVVVCVS